MHAHMVSFDALCCAALGAPDARMCARLSNICPIAASRGRWQVQAERAAWELAKQESLDLVTILPSLTLGPVISTVPTWSVDFMKVRNLHMWCCTLHESHGQQMINQDYAWWRSGKPALSSQ